MAEYAKSYGGSLARRLLEENLVKYTEADTFESQFQREEPNQNREYSGELEFVLQLLCDYGGEVLGGEDCLHLYPEKEPYLEGFAKVDDRINSREIENLANKYPNTEDINFSDELGKYIVTLAELTEDSRTFDDIGSAAALSWGFNPEQVDKAIENTGVS